mmetsp:Transcript_17955/g.49831  ORF Transcript_17955/g.49831 Transcript_17955/m.49831 type:complete len:233 (+) Transcript_17955:338-1036(+)
MLLFEAEAPSAEDPPSPSPAEPPCVGSPDLGVHNPSCGGFDSTRLALAMGSPSSLRAGSLGAGQCEKDWTDTVLRQKKQRKSSNLCGASPPSPAYSQPARVSASQASASQPSASAASPSERTGTCSNEERSLSSRRSVASSISRSDILAGSVTATSWQRQGQNGLWPSNNAASPGWPSTGFPLTSQMSPSLCTATSAPQHSQATRSRPAPAQPLRAHSMGLTPTGLANHQPG